MKDQNDETKPTPVVATPQQAGAARDRDPWRWVERCVWTERRLTRLPTSESANRPAGLDSQARQQRAATAGDTGGARPHRARRVAARSGTDLFETDFAERSCGFRPGRGDKDARRRVATLLQAGHDRVVGADLKSYFDTIPHDRLLALVKERVADGRVLALAESCLRAGVREAAKGWQPTERGTPQGGVIRPLLANLYRNPLDHQMERAGWAMVRYADDFVILSCSEAEAHAAVAAVRAWVSEAGLTLHPEKTRIVNATQPGGFDFLGYHFEQGMKWPRKKSLGKLKGRLRAKTAPRDGRRLPAIVADVNRSLRGWYQYFQHSKATTFGYVDGYVRRRLRSLLQWRKDGRG